MNNGTAAEYLGTNGNGNGNGHIKAFDIARAEDPVLAKIVPAARRECCCDTRITEGARMLYCFLTDASLWFGIYVRRGVVRFANSYLARKFDVSEKTIQNWKQALASTGRIWIAEHRMKNSFPMTSYNITAIVGQATLPIASESADGSLAEDDTYIFSNRRPARSLQRDPHTGRWRGRGDTPPIGIRPLQESKTPELSVNSAPNEKILPSATATICRSERQSIAVHSGNHLPSATATICRGERQPASVGNGNHLPSSTAINCRGERKEDADKGKTGDVSLRVPEASFKRSTGFNALKSAGGARKLSEEDLFLTDVKAVIEAWKPGASKAELTGSGVWWRLIFRKDPSLARSVLNEIRCMIREGKIKFNPGSAAVDLWTRWGGGKVSASQQKAAATAAA